MPEVDKPEPMGETFARPWRGAGAYLLVGVLGGLIVFLRVGGTVLDDHEAKAALAARSMIQRGEWLVPGPTNQELPPDTPLNRLLIPINNGRPRLQKTPLPYWCMVGGGVLLGRGDVDEFTARFPSAVAGVLCVWVILGLGSRMFGLRAAVLGALMFAVTVGFQKYGREARPEMLLCLFTTAAMGCFYVGLSARTRARRAAWMLAFWALMGLGNLVKQFFPLLLGFPLLVYLFSRASWREEEDRLLVDRTSRSLLTKYCIATVVAIAASIATTSIFARVEWPFEWLSKTAANIAIMAMLILVPLIWYGLRTRGWKEAIPLLPTAAVGIVIMFAAFLPWMWYMQKLFPQAGGIFSEQVAQRAAGTGKWGGGDPPYYYFLPLITLTLPWVGFLPGAFASAWMSRFRERRRELTYLFLWSAGLIALLTLSSEKRDHYLLPAVPAICLLMGFVADDVLLRHRWISARLGRILVICYGAALGLSPVAMVILWVAKDQVRWQYMFVVALIAAGGAIAGIVAGKRRKLPLSFALIVAAVAILIVGFHARGDLFDDRVPAADFARKSAAIVHTSPSLGSWGDPQFKTVYYFGRNIPNVFWTRQRLIAQFGEQSGDAKWRDWIKDPRNVTWIFSYGMYVEKVRELGFQVRYQVRGRQEKKTLFTLLYNTAAGEVNSEPGFQEAAGE